MMNIVRIFALIVACGTITFGAPMGMKKEEECSGSATYRVTFFNFLSRSNRVFADIVPEMGLFFSPITAVTHSPRISLLTVRGFASAPVEEVCETGANADLLEAANSSELVSSVVGGDGPVTPGGNFTVEVTATCAYPYLTVLSMIAPSPDWIVQINNMPLLKRGKFISKRAGYLIAYDCGTDSGGEFTDPMNATLDIPTEPPLNIAPLYEDETDPFGRRAVGFYEIEKMGMK